MGALFVFGCLSTLSLQPNTKMSPYVGTFPCVGPFLCLPIPPLPPDTKNTPIWMHFSCQLCPHPFPAAQHKSIPIWGLSSPSLFQLTQKMHPNGHVFHVGCLSTPLLQPNMKTS